MLIKNKKLKKSLVASLTLIASAISVVACSSSKSDTEDINYKHFSDAINGLSLKNFVSDDSSFSLFKNEFVDIDTDINFSISNEKLNVDNINLFDINSADNNFTPYKLNKLNSGFISLIDNKINFKLGEKKVTLDNILFAENFDINVEDITTKDIKENLFTNVTAFFKLSQDIKDISNPFSLNFVEWDKANVKLPSPTTQYINECKLDIGGGNANSLEADKYDFGIDHNISYFCENNVESYKKFFEENKGMYDKNTTVESFLLFDTLNSKIKEINFDSKNKITNIIFEKYDNLVAKFDPSFTTSDRVNFPGFFYLYTQYTKDKVVANKTNKFIVCPIAIE
ncbi:hypothetical protein JTY60_01835 [symbiont of Argiope bruennichi]|uniref:hypothetical protein n=1 Tax=symbiont of Argiope bruennichi TaxID=2810479 RepID=UPI003DA6882F